MVKCQIAKSTHNFNLVLLDTRKEVIQRFNKLHMYLYGD